MSENINKKRLKEKVVKLKMSETEFNLSKLENNLLSEISKFNYQKSSNVDDSSSRKEKIKQEDLNNIILYNNEDLKDSDQFFKHIINHQSETKLKEVKKYENMLSGFKSISEANMNSSYQERNQTFEVIASNNSFESVFNSLKLNSDLQLEKSVYKYFPSEKNREEGPGTFSFLPNYKIPVHGISSNSRFLFVLIGENMIYGYPLLAGGALMKPKERILDVKFQPNTSIVATDENVYIQEANNFLEIKISDFFSDSKKLNIGKKGGSGNETDACFSDGISHIALVKKDGLNKFCVKQPNKGIVEVTTNVSSKYNLDYKSPIATNGVSVSFFKFNEDRTKITVTTYSLKGGKFEDVYDNNDNIEALCVDSYNRCLWVVCNTDNIKAIRKYKYNGPINPNIYNASESNNNLTEILFNFIGSDMAPKSIIPDEIHGLELVNKIRDARDNEKLLFLIALMIDFGIKNNNKQIFSNITSAMKVIIEKNKNIASFLLFNNIDFFLKEKKSAKSSFGINIEDMIIDLLDTDSRWLNFCWRKLEQSKEFPKISFGEDNKFSSLFSRFGSITEREKSLIFLHQKCLIFSVKQYLKRIQDKTDSEEESEGKIYFDIFVDYTKFICDEMEENYSFIIGVFNNFIYLLSFICDNYIVAQKIVPIMQSLMLKILEKAEKFGTDIDISYAFYIYCLMCSQIFNIQSSYAWLIKQNVNNKRQIECLFNEDYSDITNQNIIDFLNNNDALKELKNNALDRNISDKCKELDKFALIAMAKWGGFVSDVIKYKKIVKDENDSLVNRGIVKNAYNKVIGLRKWHTRMKHKALSDKDFYGLTEEQRQDKKEKYQKEEAEKEKELEVKDRIFKEKCLLLLRFNPPELNDQKEVEIIVNEVTHFLSDIKTEAKDIIESIKNQKKCKAIIINTFETMTKIYEKGGPEQKDILFYTLSKIEDFSEFNKRLEISNLQVVDLEKINSFFEKTAKEASNFMSLFEYKFFRDVNCIPSIKEKVMERIVTLFMDQSCPISYLGLALVLVRGSKRVPISFTKFLANYDDCKPSDKDNEYHNKSLAWVILSELSKTAQINETMFSAVIRIMKNSPDSLPYFSSLVVNLFKASRLNDDLEIHIRMLISEIGESFIKRSNLEYAYSLIWIIRKLIVDNYDDMGERVEDILYSYDDSNFYGEEYLVGSVAILGNSLEKLHAHGRVKHNNSLTDVKEYVLENDVSGNVSCYKYPIDILETPEKIFIDNENTYGVPSLRLKMENIRKKNELRNYLSSLWNICTERTNGRILPELYMQTLSSFLDDEELAKMICGKLKRIKHIMPFSDIPFTFNNDFGSIEKLEQSFFYESIKGKNGMDTIISKELEDSCAFNYAIKMNSKPEKLYVGIISSNLDFYKTQYTIVDINSDTILPYNIKANINMKELIFDVFIDKEASHFSINDKKFLFPYGNKFKFVICSNKIDEITLSHKEKGVKYSSKPMPEIDSVGCNFIYEDKENQISVKENEVFKPNIETAREYYSHYISPPDGIVLHINNAAAVSKGLEKEFNNAREEKLFYQFSTVALMKCAKFFPDVVNRNILVKFVSILATQLDIFSRNSDGMASFFKNPIWDKNVDHINIYDSLSTASINALESIVSSKGELLEKELKKAITNTVTSENVNFILFPSKYHIWLREGTFKDKMNFIAKNIIINSANTVDTLVNCIDKANNKVELPLIIEQENESICFQNKPPKSDVTLYSIDEISNMWAFDTIFEALELIKTLFFISSDIHNNVFIKTVLLTLFCEHSPLYIPFAEKIIGDLPLTFFAPVDKDNKDKEYESIKNISETKLKAYKGSIKAKCEEALKFIKLIEFSENSSMIVQLFPDIYGMKPAPIQEEKMKVNVPKIDIGSMNEGDINKLESLLKNIDGQRYSLKGSLFFEAIGLWLRVLEERKQGNILMRKFNSDFVKARVEKGNNKLTIFNPFEVDFTFKIENTNFLFRNDKYITLTYNDNTNDEEMEVIETNEYSITRKCKKVEIILVDAKPNWVYNCKYSIDQKIPDNYITKEYLDIRVKAYLIKGKEKITVMNPLGIPYEINKENDRNYSVKKSDKFFQFESDNCNYTIKQEINDSNNNIIDIEQFRKDIIEFTTKWTTQDTIELYNSLPSGILSSETSDCVLQFANEARIKNKDNYLFQKFSPNVIAMRIILIQYFNYICSQDEKKKESLYNDFPHYINPESILKKVLGSIKNAPEKTRPRYMSIDRTVAFNLMNSGTGDPNNSIISQIGREIEDWKPDELRINGEYFWKVELVDEGAIDAGGPMKEALRQGCESIFDKTSCLTVPIPNCVESGKYDKFLPILKSGDRERDFWAIGQVFGVILRSGVTQDLPFANIVWKYLAYEKITEEDFMRIDDDFEKVVNDLRHNTVETIENKRQTWTTKDFFQNEVALPDKSMDQLVEENEIEEYIKACVQLKLDMISQPLSIIRDSLEDNIGISTKMFCSAASLSKALQGNPYISISELKSVTTYYSPYDENNKHIKVFWSALEEFDNEELKLFLMFVCSVNRIPKNNFRIKISKLNNTFTKRDKTKAEYDPNDLCPVAHTCFNQVDIPEYTIKEKAKEKILIAIKSVGSISD